MTHMNRYEHGLTHPSHFVGKHLEKKFDEDLPISLHTMIVDRTIWNGFGIRLVETSDVEVIGTQHTPTKRAFHIFHFFKALWVNAPLLSSDWGINVDTGIKRSPKKKTLLKPSHVLEHKQCYSKHQ